MTRRNSSVERVQEVIRSLNIPTSVLELPDSTKTAREAAAAVDCHVAQIVKSLVFLIEGTNQPILILTSGANQVDEKHVSAQIGDDIQFATADRVREDTGFAIGGVSPFGLKKQVPIYIDQDLLDHPVVWAAAGSHHAVFSIHPQDLVRATQGIVIRVQ